MFPKVIYLPMMVILPNYSTELVNFLSLEELPFQFPMRFFYPSLDDRSIVAHTVFQEQLDNFQYKHQDLWDMVLEQMQILYRGESPERLEKSVLGVIFFNWCIYQNILQLTKRDQSICTYKEMSLSGAN